MSNDRILDADIYALPKACILCDEEAYDADLCRAHTLEFEAWRNSSAHTPRAFLAVKIREIRSLSLKYMETVQSEADHIRGRARAFLNDPSQSNGYALAKSAIKHLAVIAREEV